MHDYDVFLTKCGLCHVMGDSVCGTCSVTVDILLNVFRHFNLSCLLHVCMHAAFLVALFSFLHMSNLVPYSFDDLSYSTNNFLQRKNVSYTPTGAILQVYSTKTIQCCQRSLEIPLPFIPDAVLCPVTALSCYLHSVPAPTDSPLLLFLGAIPRATFHPKTTLLRTFTQSHPPSGFSNQFMGNTV